MKRAFYLLDEFPNVVQGKAWFEIAEIAGNDLERLPLCRGAPAGQASSERVVDAVAERPPRATRFGLQLCCHIVIQGECRSRMVKAS